MSSQLQLPEDLQGAPSSSLRVYVALGALEPGAAVSSSALESRTGLSRRSVWRALRRLEARGLLERLPQTTPEGMKQANRYRLGSNAAPADVITLEPSTPDVPRENPAEIDAPRFMAHPETVLPDRIREALGGAPSSSVRVCAALCALEPGDAVSSATLESRTGLSRRSVWRALRDLTDRELLERLPQTRAGLKQANRYRVRGLGPEPRGRAPEARARAAAAPAGLVATPVSAPEATPVLTPLVDEHLVRSFSERLASSMRVHPSGRWWEQARRGDARTVDAFHQDLLKGQASDQEAPDRRTVRAALLEAGRRHRRAEEIAEAARELALEAPEGAPALAWVCDVVERTGATKAELLALYVADLIWLQTASNPRELPADKLEASAITYRRGTFVFVQG